MPTVITLSPTLLYFFFLILKLSLSTCWAFLLKLLVSTFSPTHLSDARSEYRIRRSPILRRLVEQACGSLFCIRKPHVTTVAIAITFLISALAHELVMGCITRKFRGNGFFAMMPQMPIVIVQWSRFVRGRTLLNVRFSCVVCC